MLIETELDEWQPSPVIRKAGRGYCRKAATEYRDAAACLTARQAVFYRNLISLALTLRSRDIPVDFQLSDGSRRYLDRGCIKIAEHAGFIQPLADDASGTVASVRLARSVDGATR